MRSHALTPGDRVRGEAAVGRDRCVDGLRPPAARLTPESRLKLSTALRLPRAAADDGLVTLIERWTSPATDRRSESRTHLIANLIVAVAVLAVSLAVAAPAGAVVTEVGGTSVGLQPRTEVLDEGEPATFANNSGNAIVDGAKVYAVYWDPSDVFFDNHHEWLVHLDGFFQQMGAGSGDIGTMFAPLGQYRDRANAQAAYHTVFMGSYTDSTAYPIAGCTDPKPLAKGAMTCLTDAQLRAQLQSFIAAHGTSKGMNTIYDLITPPGVTVCLDAAATHCSDYKVSKTEEENEERKSVSYEDSFCSYHGDINPDAATEGDGNTILYAAIPWTAAGTLGDFFETPSTRFYAQGDQCEDGGWNPEKHEENKEVPREVTAAEITAHEKDTAEQHKEFLEQLRLEGPHQQEPNQEGKGESGDYSPGLADLIVNQVAEEQANIVTDPLLNGWKDAEGREVTDECRDAFASTAGPSGGEIGGTVLAQKGTEAGTIFNSNIGGGNYYINNVFNFASGGCVGGVGLVPRFTAPNPVNTSELVDFDGMESTVSLLRGESFGPIGPPSTTYATFRWSFGDGTEASGFAPNSVPCEAPWLSPCAGSIFHAYQYGGTYKVTLTVTDVAGDTAAVEHEVTVAGPPAPTPPSSSTGSTGSSPGGSGGPGGSNGAGAAAANVPAPVAAASIISKSLRTLNKGLAVRYSVNEQVAGRFEVLLSRTVARKLKIGGAPAVGLPPGSAPQLVIAKAILVTTKGGHSTVHILLSKKTAASLGRAHKVSLMLRLTVRNAASKSPATTTVISSSTLSR
jgi:hypothetical protein